MLFTQACNCRRQKKIISTVPLPLRITTSSLRKDIGNYVFVQSVEEYANQDIFGYWEKRNTSIVPTVLSTSLLEDWHDNGIFPVFGVSQICKTSLYKLEASITATMFPDFGSYTTPSKGFTFLSCTDGIQPLIQFRIFINKCNVRPRCSGVHGRAINLSCPVK